MNNAHPNLRAPSRRLGGIRARLVFPVAAAVTLVAPGDRAIPGEDLSCV